MEKKMIIPVTSTKVATKGAEAVAGSNFIFFKRKGINDPDSVPQSTIKTKDTDTVSATSNQNSP